MDIKLAAHSRFVAFSPTGGTIAVADTTAHTRFFLASSGTRFLEHAFDAPRARSRADLLHRFSPDGRYYALSREFVVSVLDLATGEVVRAVEISKAERGNVARFAFTAASELVISDAGRLYTLGIEDGRERTITTLRDGEWCGLLEAAPDGTLAWLTLSEERCDTLMLVDLATGTLREVDLPSAPLPHLRSMSQNFMSVAAFADAGRTVRVLRKGRGLLDIDTATGAIRRERTWDELGCHCIHNFWSCAFFGEGRYLGLPAESGTFTAGSWSVPWGKGERWRVWDLDADTLLVNDTEPCHGFALDPRSRRAARIHVAKEPRRKEWLAVEPV